MFANTLCAGLLFTGQVLGVAHSHGSKASKILDRNILSQRLDKRESNIQAPLYPTKFSGVTWDNTNWRLTTTVLDQGHYQSRGSIANGYLGISVAAVGPFFELDVPVNGDVINGWPLFSRRQTFATISGFHDLQPETNGTNFPWMNQYGGESVISGVPHWSGMILDLGQDGYLDASVENSTISDFVSTLDMKAGTLTWKYKWTPAGRNDSFDIAYQLFAHKLHVNQAVVHMEITPSTNIDATIVNILEGYSAVRTQFAGSGTDGQAIYSSVRPDGISNVTAYIYAQMAGTDEVDMSTLSLVTDKPYIRRNDSTIAQAVSVRLRAGVTTGVTKFVGAASTDGFADPRLVAKDSCAKALNNGFETSLRSHIGEWAIVFPDDSVDNFSLPDTGHLPLDNHIIESAITAVANPYYLLQTTVSTNARKAVNDAPINRGSMAVGGLTSDSYAGLVFWDADIWMQPGFVPAFPEAAQSFTNYRVDKYGQALANAQTAFTSSKNRTHISPDAAIYSWTSGRFGNCTGTGPCFDYQYHLNGDIGLQLINNWVTTGDTEYFKSDLFPLYNSIATLFADVLERNGSKWTLTNMTDPDEYANHVDAGGFTMPMIASTLIYANSFRQMFGLEQNQTWNDMAENVLISRDPSSSITLEYTTMNGSTQVKQADIVLNTFPLRYTENYSPENALLDLDYYAAKQSPDGPAMTYAIFSIVANEVSPSGCSAYTYAQYSFSPYVRAPFFQFSEQLVDDWLTNGGTHPAFPFLTGKGGANQVVLFGYLGYRLLPDSVLHIDPNLPPQIPHINYRTFYWHGWPIKAESNYTHTTIRRAQHRTALPTADQRFADAPIPVHVGPESNVTVYSLPPSGDLVIQNRQIGSIDTFPGNLVQCQPVSSPHEYLPGQFPIAAVDGAASTKWQPTRANMTASLTVTFPESALSSSISGFGFDWAQAPPQNAKVLLHDFPLPPVLDIFAESPPGSIVVADLSEIAVSDPYKPNVTDLNKIMRYKGNTTNVTLSSPVPVTKFATLLISGNQGLGDAEIKAGNGTGATVAEWSILGAGGLGSNGREDKPAVNKFRIRGVPWTNKV
ncbi:Acid trehalase precursor, putative [Coccidioides posadasii C735 delta SOWgp]|uniref:alpha,alpha-trehalase n=1 Tax=Coccidioides posadasii (strain C735) TaxID=222929 RepID=C5P3J3_COCP7|nr:Acid trehalase precursor, putative [Coccidioides posadasii C735 delta SOWgp]EER28261.1 Acid trehalase precursor, putative [Coccidioides posadasii C735 delta SOWgp]|eukprot:XP_003070406.1 Acid trehalase precursor, putative [Coccidioides posadasii C735 delta SOWgp]